MELKTATKTALIVGGDELVGLQCLKIALLSGLYKKVVSIGKTKIDFQHPKFKQYVVDYEDKAQLKTLLQGDDLFCCLRNRIALGNNDWIKSDFKYSYEIAQIASANQVSQLLLLSSAGANESSMLSYNKFKGQIEQLAQHQSFWSIHIFRPAILLEDKVEDDFGEQISKRIGSFLDKFTRGFVSKYRPIEAEYVAKAMIKVAQRPLESGVFSYLTTDIEDLAKGFS